MKVVRDRQTISLRVELTPGELAQLGTEMHAMDPPYALSAGIHPAPWQNPPKWPLTLSLLSALVFAVSEEE